MLNKNIIPEQTLLCLLIIWEDHASKPILDVMGPLTLVLRAVSPFHLSKTVPLISVVITFVNITALPCENARALLIIIYIITFVDITALGCGAASPFTLTVAFAVFKLAHVRGTICPGVLPAAFRLTVFVLTGIAITRNE